MMKLPCLLTSGEWCKSSLFELATRIPMFVVVPQSVQKLSSFSAASASSSSSAATAAAAGLAWNNGVISKIIVESVDLMITLADLAGIPLPAEQFGGESLRPLLLAGATALSSSSSSDVDGVAPRKKTWAMSQWPRRPSCVSTHGCTDGHGNPYEPANDQAGERC